jgi:S-DNA-T family DNA segregation ATPase FtsK/SpoIIIE
MRRSLIVVEPTGVRQITIDGPRVTLGRDDDNDVVIGDPTASRHHAAIEIDEDSAWVVDVGSRNGTELNGLPVNRFALKHRDVLTIGATRLRFSEVILTYRDSDLGIAP